MIAVASKLLQLFVGFAVVPFTDIKGNLVVSKRTSMEEMGGRRKRTSLKKKAMGNNGRNNGEMETLLADTSRFLERIRTSLSEVFILEINNSLFIVQGASQGGGGACLQAGGLCQQQLQAGFALL